MKLSDYNVTAVNLTTDPIYTDIEKWSFWVCDECGVLVHDPARHNTWHKEMRRVERFS